MATETNTARTQELPDIQAVIERLTAANRKAGNDHLDLVEKTVSQVSTWQLKAAAAVHLPGVTELVESQVGVGRDIADTYVRTARDLINAQ